MRIARKTHHMATSLEARCSASLQVSLALFPGQGFNPHQTDRHKLGIDGGGMLQERFQAVLHLVWWEAEIMEKHRERHLPCRLFFFYWYC